MDIFVPDLCSERLLLIQLLAPWFVDGIIIGRLRVKLQRRLHVNLQRRHRSLGAEAKPAFLH